MKKKHRGLSKLIAVVGFYPKYEIVVIDSSTDRTPEIAGKIKNLRVFSLKGLGFAHARNSGIKNSRNEVIAFTDADCIVPKDWLKNLSRL